MSPRLVLAFAVVALGFAAIAALLIPNPAPRPAQPVPAVAVAAPAAHTGPIYGGTNVSADLDDEAYLADLFDGQETEVTAQRRADLVAIGHRVCDLAQPRSEWLASLTAGGYTPGEAGKILDTATAAFCPARSAV
jgi:hypothetical protein